jgi:hypothetical protein
MEDVHSDTLGLRVDFEVRYETFEEGEALGDHGGFSILRDAC